MYDSQRPILGVASVLGFMLSSNVAAGGTLGSKEPGTVEQAVRVLSYQKISDTEGDFHGVLDNDDHFGRSVASLGDLDGDGPSVLALAVGANNDDDGGNDRGAVWILFLDMDGTVESYQKISSTQGGGPPLDDGDRFGTELAALGDLDGNGVTDLAVGARYDDGQGIDRGAVWILFLNSDGTVNHHQKISDTEVPLDDDDWFGVSIAAEDLNGDGIVDLAVGAQGDDDDGMNKGAVWILFLDTEGMVRGHVKISADSGGFTGDLDNGDHFGSSVAALGDVDGDGIPDLAVGAQFDDDGGNDRGAQWVLFLNKGGTVKGHQKISDTEGCFAGVLEDGDRFGLNGPLGDIDGDGFVDLAVGEMDGPNEGSAEPGAVWILQLNGDGTVKSQDKISDIEGCFHGALNGSDGFGVTLDNLGNLDGNGVTDIAVGAWRDDDGGNDGLANRGAVWILFLGLPPPCPADLIGDCTVGVLDLLDLLANWGPCEADCSNCPADFDDSGDVGVKDLLILLGAWGPCP